MPIDYEHRPMPDHDQWPAFSVPWDDTTTGPTDMSYLLEKPAGAKGFVQIRDGHLVAGDGQRLRIWGQNITGNAMMPPMEQAPIIARRLAKFGINCLRLHHMDHRWPGGVLIRRLKPDRAASMPGVGDTMRRDDEPTRALDPEALARLDYFIACCRREGIYIDVNLNVSRPFTAADGVKQVEWIGYGKALTYFDPQLIKLQKEYAAQLLGHVNPYTGCRYAEDPAIAIVELVNENSILESWVRGRLRGQQTTPFGTWGDIPSAYAADLDRLYNAWLARHYPDRAALAAAWAGDLREDENAAQGSVRRLRPEDFAAASAGRFRDEATFYAELERDFFTDMASYLRGEVGVRQPIIGTSDHSHGINGTLHVKNNAALGIVDGHCYWQHPRYLSGDSGRQGWLITNTAMIDAPDHSAVAQVARSVVAGLPYTLSEINEPFPNDYAAEYIPIMGAYAAFQDWDGIFWYAYGGGTREGQDRWRSGMIEGFFSMANDPVKMAETALGALVFLRGDVQAAREMVLRKLNPERVIESLRADLPDDVHPFEIPYLPGRLALVHRTAISDYDAEALSPAEGELALPQGEIISDTGELTWVEGETPCVRFDTPRYQAVIGWAGDAATSNLAVDLQTDFAAVQLATLDGKPVAESERMWLLACARVANTGMKWADDTRKTLTGGWGEAPTRIEPVAAAVTLKGLEGAQGVALQPLDGCGQPTGEPLAFSSTAEGWQARLLETAGTIWYMIDVQR